MSEIGWLWLELVFDAPALFKRLSVIDEALHGSINAAMVGARFQEWLPCPVLAIAQEAAVHTDQLIDSSGRRPRAELPVWLGLGREQHRSHSLNIRGLSEFN